ncbi:MAG: outer membrane beta-barrel protein [Muribaculaceae bacterium]|nr:outer membrane beta-barrel protein [Muribaculaceae bacterium]
MKRPIALLAAVICGVVSVNARSVQGVVLSANDSTTVAGATCRLMADGKQITGAATDLNGGFLLETDIKSPLNLEVSLAGYASTDIIIESGVKNINVGAIYLDAARTLDEVSVTANSVLHSKGRTIVYPSSADVKASSSAISLFQKLPLDGLEANPITRAISVDGGGPVILINGIPSTMSDVNALQPKDIEKIEYSRFTPARYADKGGSGFISITLKKRDDGGQVYLWGRAAVTTVFGDADLRASYHQGPSQFTLSYNPSWRKYNKVYDNLTESYIGDDFRVNLETHDRAPFYYHTHQMRFRYDYSPSMKTLFSATFTATPDVTKHSAMAHTLDSQLGEYDNNNVARSKEFSPSLDLFLRQDFNEKNSLEVEVVGTLSSNDYRRDNRYMYADGREDSYIMNADSRRRSLISEVSYIHNFSNKTQLSAGLQNTVSHSTNSYLDTDFKPVLTENNNYVYARLGQSIGNIYLSLSTGAKLYWIKNDNTKRNFIRNISTARLSWRVAQKWNIDGSFSYTPNIPSLSSLTDYPQQISPYLVSNGNPDLKVSDNITVLLAPSYSYKKFSASLNLYYGSVRNPVISDVRYLGNELFLSQSINARRRWQTQAGLNLRLTEIAGFGANVSFVVGHSEILGPDWNHHLTSFNANINLWWNKGPFTISYWRKIPGKYLYGHKIGTDENGDALQFNYAPNNHWNFGVSWMYMFDKKGTRYPSWDYSNVNPSIRERYIKDNGNMVTLTVSYNADFGSIFRSARRNLNNSDEGSSLLKM